MVAALDWRNEEWRDSRNLLYYIIKNTVEGSPDPTPLQYDLCKKMENAIYKIVFKTAKADKDDDAAERRLIVKAFRGVAKSLIASTLTIWALYWNQSLNIMIASAAEDRAVEFSTFVLKCLRELPELQWLAPGDGCRDSVKSFDVAGSPIQHAPSVKSVGILGRITGSRADIIFADDIESSKNSSTDLKRKLISESVKEFAAVRKPVSVTIFLGTPQIEESLYNTLEKERGYTAIIWPARYPDAAWMERSGSSLAPLLANALRMNPSLVGKPTDPERFNEFVLADKEAEYGRSGFDLQFMLSTALSDLTRYPLKLADFIVTTFGIEKAPLSIKWTDDRKHEVDGIPSPGLGLDRFYCGIDVSPDSARFEGGVLTVDPAGHGKDECAWTVSKLAAGLVWIHLVRGVQTGYEDATMVAICEDAKRFKVERIVVEDNFGDGMFLSLLQPHLKRIYPNCGLEPVHHVGQKEKRIIDVLEPALNQHRVVIHRDILVDDMTAREADSKDDREAYSLFHQMTRVTKERGCLLHEDRLESLAMGVNVWVEHMKSTEEAARRRASERSMEEEIQSWYERHPYQKPAVSKIGHRSTLKDYIGRNPRKKK